MALKKLQYHHHILNIVLGIHRLLNLCDKMSILGVFESINWAKMLQYFNVVTVSKTHGSLVACIQGKKLKAKGVGLKNAGALRDLWLIISVTLANVCFTVGRCLLDFF